MSPRALDLPVALVESGGRLIIKDELLERVWARSAVEENALLAQLLDALAERIQIMGGVAPALATQVAKAPQTLQSERWR